MTDPSPKKRKKWKGGKKNLKAYRWRKQGRACAYCKRPMPLAHATLDHVFPRSKSKHENPDRDDNLIVACFFCNNTRGDMEFVAFLKLIEQLKADNKLGPTWHLNKTKLRKTLGLAKRLADMRYRPFPH